MRGLALLLGLLGAAAFAQTPTDEPIFTELAGITFQVLKTDSQTLYLRDGRAYTMEEIRAAAQLYPAPKISAELSNILGRLPFGQQIDVVIYLVQQPAAPIAHAVKQKRESAMTKLLEQAKWIARLQRPAVSLSPEEEKMLQPLPIDESLIAWRKAIAQQIDTLRDEIRLEIAERVSRAVAPGQRSLALAIERLGGRVGSSTAVMNTMAATLPAGFVTVLAQRDDVRFVTLDHAGAPELDQQKESLGLTRGFWPNGFDGNTYDVGVLDTGVQANHPNFGTHRFEGQSTSDPDGHGTGIAGILASDHATYRGMAFGCDTISAAFAGADSQSMNGMNWLMTQVNEGAENVNYSFGNGTANDVDYSPFDSFFDGVIDTFDIMVSKSTGNNGWGTTTITHPAPAYNLLASANMDDQNTATRADDLITSSSSRGPTKGGRKKPDITAPGTNTMTTTRSGGFGNLGGTSSASPHTGGGIVLLNDLGTLDPRAAKAVLLNAADAWTDGNTSGTSDDGPVVGSFWCKTFGWGYLDLEEAYFNGTDVFVGSVKSNNQPGDYKLYKGQMFNGEKATLVWNRHVAYNGAQYPTQVESHSDLDLYAYSETTGSKVAESKSAIDSVEQLSTTADDVIVLKVASAAAFDPDVPEETFGLATEENFVAASGPSFSVAFTAPPFVQPGEVFTLTVQVKNTGDVTAHGNSVLLSGITILSGDNPQSLPSIPAGKSQTASWQVQAQNQPGQQIVTADVASASYGESFTGQGSATILVSGSQPDILHPDTVQIVKGTFNSGTVASLGADDDDYWIQSAAYDPTDPTAFINSLYYADTRVNQSSYTLGKVLIVEKSSSAVTRFRVRALKNDGFNWGLLVEAPGTMTESTLQSDLNPVNDFIFNLMMRLEIRNSSANRLAGFFRHFTDLVEWQLLP